MTVSEKLSVCTWTSLYLIVLLPVIAETRSVPGHKVHNIVLYPSRHEWCDDTPIQMVISHPTCQSVTIENRVCVGTCFSYSVPASLPRNVHDDRLHYCDSCQPKNHTWVKVELHCPKQTTVTKMVQVVLSCSCEPCRLPDLPQEGVTNTTEDSASTQEPTASPASSAEDVFMKLLRRKGEPVPPSVVKAMQMKSRQVVSEVDTRNETSNEAEMINTGV